MCVEFHIKLDKIVKQNLKNKAKNNTCIYQKCLFNFSIHNTVINNMRTIIMIFFLLLKLSLWLNLLECKIYFIWLRCLISSQSFTIIQKYDKNLFQTTFNESYEKIINSLLAIDSSTIFNLSTLKIMMFFILLFYTYTILIIIMKGNKIPNLCKLMVKIILRFLI